MLQITDARIPSAFLATMAEEGAWCVLLVSFARKFDCSVWVVSGCFTSALLRPTTGFVMQRVAQASNVTMPW